MLWASSFVSTCFTATMHPMMREKASTAGAYKTSSVGVAPAHFIIEGGRRLRGSITINGSKNGAVVLLCASLLNRGRTTFLNIPRIEEVERLLEVLRSIGVRTERKGNALALTLPKKISLATLNEEAARR